MRPDKCPLGRAHRQQTVAIDRLEPHRGQIFHSGGRGQGDGIIVSHHHARPLADCHSKLAAVARKFLHIGMVQHCRPGKPPTIVGHALQHEAMAAIGVPGSTAGKRLDDQQRPSQLPGPADGPLEREVPAGSPGCGHPVDDEVAIPVWWQVTNQAETQRGNAADLGSIFRAGYACHLAISQNDPSYVGRPQLSIGQALLVGPRDSNAMG